MLKECVSCGMSDEIDEDILAPHCAVMCTVCGWLTVWDDTLFRAPTQFELDLLKGTLSVMVELGQIAIDRQKRIGLWRNE